MTGYQIGIAYATGYFANDAEPNYLVVRNLDRFYPDQIARVSEYKTYESLHNIQRDGKPQYAVKARDIHSLPEIYDIDDIQGFCRAYIELHGTIDIMTAKKRDGTRYKKPRLRIYGREEIISMLNSVLPAKEKKLQYITNKIEEKYTGSTTAIYYQWEKEILDILEWIAGEPKNERVWRKWNEIIKSK